LVLRNEGEYPMLSTRLPSQPDSILARIYTFHVAYWCPDCGEGFRGQLHIQTIEKSGQIGQRRDACPFCGKRRVSPLVRPGSIIEDSSHLTTPSLQHDIEAMKLAVDEGDNPSDLAQILSFIKKHHSVIDQPHRLRWWQKLIRHKKPQPKE
jgi:DNA-directed RNA polymerase subunit RPC12/RpoP